MVDLHSHILHDMDDGAGSFEEAVRLCMLGNMNRINKIVATPHFNALGNIENFINQRDERLALLKEALRDKYIDVHLFPGAEVFVDDDIFFAKNLKDLTINKSRYLLVEFNFFGLRFKNIVDYLKELTQMGIVPIIAHPERYEFFQKDYDAVNELASRGYLFQLNAGSLASRDGIEEFELAYEMAYKGIASFIGTDAHSLKYRPNDIREMLRIFPQDIDRVYMQRMLVNNPERVLNDEKIPMNKFMPIEKRRYY